MSASLNAIYSPNAQNLDSFAGTSCRPYMDESSSGEQNVLHCHIGFPGIRVEISLMLRKDHDPSNHLLVISESQIRSSRTIVKPGISHSIGS